MNNELTKKVERKVQFAVMLALFFPVVIEALFDLDGNNQIETSANILKLGLIIFLLIANYLIFEWRREQLPLRYLLYLNWGFTATISFFALLILFFAYVANGDITDFNSLTKFLYVSLLVGIWILPLFSLLLIGGQYFYNSIKN